MALSSVKPLKLATFSSASLSGTYQVINTNGFAKPPFYIRINNGGSTAITISFNGVDDHEYLQTLQAWELSSQQNAAPNNWVCKWPVGTKVYVKGTAGTGTISLSGYYQDNNL